MVLTEKEMEKWLMEAGGRLLSPPSSTAELLALLDRVENFLAAVEQSPSESMKQALTPSMKALIADGLLRHSDADVKVSVAACISEITRITAPDAPYEDDQMKEVFQLIVSSFEKLDDKSSPSYIKRTSILETVAKVRSCVVMLDLECDALIVEMFQYFFRSIRDDHPENVFSSMETIMTLVLEESEDISSDLLFSILNFLKAENKEILPIARQLAEKVVEKCASKLKPFLLPTLKSQGAPSGYYGKIVANLYQTGPEDVEPSDEDAVSKNLADKSDLTKALPEKAVEVAMETLDGAPPNDEAGPSSVGSPKSNMSNGTLQKETEVTSEGNDDSKEADHDTHVSDERVETDVEKSKTDSGSLGAEQPIKLPSKPEKSNKRKGRKTNALKSSLESSEPELSPTHDVKETVNVPENQEKDSKEVDGAKALDPAINATESAEIKKKFDAPVSTAKMSENKPIDVPSPPPSEKLADESHPKKIVRLKIKNDSVQESKPAYDIDSKKQSDAKNKSEETGGIETKSHKRSGKRASSAAAKEDGTSSSVDAVNNEDGAKELDAKSAKHSVKKVDGSSQLDAKKKRGQVKATPGKEVKATPAKDLLKTPSKGAGKKPLLESTGKSTKDENDVEKSSKSGSKRKRSSGETKVFKAPVFGPELVGSKVKVLWPKDKAYYEGVIHSFDPVKLKHTVIYVDGDVEVLNLVNQKWELIDDESGADQENLSEGGSPDESSETPKGKKAKTIVDLGSKRGKTDSSSKKLNTPSSKSKVTPKSGRKQDCSKVDGKTKEESSKGVRKSDEDKDGKSKKSKSGKKSSDNTAKSVGKSKVEDVDASKGSRELKKDKTKDSSKSKNKSPNSGGKSKTDGSGKPKSGKSKDDEEEDAELSPEPAKTPETSKGKSASSSKFHKSGDKRKRAVKS